MTISQTITPTTSNNWLEKLGHNVAAKAILAFIVVLPLHSLIITILLAQLKLPFGIVRSIAAWKEVLLGLTFGIAMLALVWRYLHYQPLRLIWVDWVALAWVALVIVYFGLQDDVLNARPNLIGKAYGARDWLLYTMPYFIGRLLPFSQKQIKQILHSIFGVGLFTCIIAIFEYFFVPIEWHVRLGVPIYFRDFLNTYVLEWLYNLPSNYWIEATPTTVLRRAVSIYLSGQGFALPFLVVIPVVVHLFCCKPTLVRSVATVIVFAGLALNLTRMTIIAGFLEALLVILIHRNWKLMLAVIIGASIGLGVGMAASPKIRSFVTRSISGQETSIGTRGAQWVEGMGDLSQYPLGHGLGFSGQVGYRTSKVVVDGQGQEAGYLKLTGDLGLPGLALFIAWFVGILVTAFAVMRRIKINDQDLGNPRDLAIVVFTIALGFLLNNVAAPPDQSPFVIYLFPWLAGCLVAWQQQFKA